MKTRMNVGISSLILIFIVLCLVTFGLLSMSSARNDLTMAERNGDSVREYYRADGEGERFIAMIDGKLKSAADPEAQGPQDIPESSMEQALKELGDFYDEEQQVIHTDIPMERGQAEKKEPGAGSFLFMYIIRKTMRSTSLCRYGPASREEKTWNIQRKNY